MSLKAKLEAIIYAAEEPVTLNELASLLKDAVLAEQPTEDAPTPAESSASEAPSDAAAPSVA